MGKKLNQGVPLLRRVGLSAILRTAAIPHALRQSSVMDEIDCLVSRSTISVKGIECNMLEMSEL